MTKDERQSAKKLALKRITEIYPGGDLNRETHEYTFDIPGGTSIIINLVDGTWKNKFNPNFCGKEAHKLIAVLEQKPEKEVLENLLSGKGYREILLSKEKLYDNIYFEVLGFNKGTYYFLSKQFGQIFSVQYQGLNVSLYQQLAPIDFWAKIGFGEMTKGGDFKFQPINITDHLRSIFVSRGVFSFKRVRCRGAWIEDDRVIINTGLDIIDKGKRVPLSLYKSSYIYEKGEEIAFNMQDPLTDEKGEEIFRHIKRMSFKHKSMAYFLIGWCVVAPFGGALEWRPHIFLTGGSGTGKSSVIRLVINTILGDFVIKSVGGSSEASLRRGISGDSIPIVIDEGEPGENDHRSGMDISKQIELARISSSEEPGTLGIMRVEGKEVTCYRLRSCWLFSAVFKSIVNSADVSRFSIIEMTKGYQGGDWLHFEAQLRMCITKDVAEKLKSRVIIHFDILKKNIRTFRIAVSDVFENSRIGDQIGTLLAGAVFIESLKEYSLEEAKELIVDIGIDETLHHLNNANDEMRCFDRIMQLKIRELGEVPIIAALNDLYYYMEYNNREESRRVGKILKTYGFTYSEIKGKTYMFMMQENTHITDALRGTLFKKNYSDVLQRLEFCLGRRQSIRFGDLGRKPAIMFDPAGFLNDQYEER